MRKKQVLFVYPDMIVGGSTSALLALLQELDYTSMDVDILFLHNGNVRLEELPPQVRVLPDAVSVGLAELPFRIKKLANLIFTGKAFVALKAVRWWGHHPFHMYWRAALNQMLARIHSEYAYTIRKQYDVAIAYLELWPTIYVAQNANAKKKIAWCHVDYSAARLIPELDKEYYAKMDRIYCVSSECAEQFKVCFPTLKNKVTWMENFLNKQAILEKSLIERDVEEVFLQNQNYRIVTVARLDSYTKGLDRIVTITRCLKEEGLRFTWYIIGGGADERELRRNIVTNNLQNYLILLGEKSNPYPYIARANLFVLASRNEGKPIVVSEAKILGVPILVTAYPSAQRQLEGAKGWVVENSEEGLLQKLREILQIKEPE